MKATGEGRCMGEKGGDPTTETKVHQQGTFSTFMSQTIK